MSAYSWVIRTSGLDLAGDGKGRDSSRDFLLVQAPADIDSVFGVPATTHNWSIEFGASALLYLSDTDRLRTYLAPQFTYTRSEASSSTGTIGAVGNSYGFAGLFGAQTPLNDRFSVFGELGVGYTHDTNTTGRVLSGLDTKRDSWGTRTGVGVILYF